jgi:hypothetical protein
MLKFTIIEGLHAVYEALKSGHRNTSLGEIDSYQITFGPREEPVRILIWFR